MSWLQRLFSRKRLEIDLDKELLFHFEAQVADKVRSGIPETEARRLTRLEFGGIEQIKEDCRESRGTLWLESIVQDVRYALRQLLRSPGFTITCVLILALGIGAVTAVFSLIDAALLRMLPVKAPEQLVQLKTISPDFPANDAFSYSAFQRLSRQTQVLAGLIAFRRQHNIDLEFDGQSGLAEGQSVSGSYFSVLGVRAIRGRTLIEADESVASPVAVIGYDYWRSRFSLDPEIVGKKILLNNAPYTVVGVTEPEFYGLEAGARIDVSIPLTAYSQINPGYAAKGTPYDVLKAPFRNWLEVIGRLQSGVTGERTTTATAALEPVFTQIKDEMNESLMGTPGDSPARRQTILALRLQLDPASQGLATLRQEFSRPLWIVMSLVGLLLIITCANVANLLLARANTKEKEIAVRLAKGSGKGRLMRQLIVESSLLALIGGALGVGLAFWGSGSLLALMAHGRKPVMLSVHPNLTVLAFALAISLLTAVIFGILPAWRATDVDPSRGLAQSARAASAPERPRLGKALVVLQVAVSLVLAIGAGLLARSLSNLRDFYPGFNRDKVLLFHVDPPIVGITDVVPIYEQLIGRILQLPGIRTASLSVHEPLSANVSDTALKVQGVTAGQQDDMTPVNVEPIGPGYFATMQTPILGGREFTDSDRSGTPKVAIVNQSTARHFFGTANPIGRFVSIPGYRADTSWLEIVGEVRDIKVHDLREASTPMLYVPMWQAAEGGATFEVRAAGDPAKAATAVLEAVRSVNSRLPIYSVKTLGDQLDDSLVEERLVASLSETFGFMALLLTCIGLYGQMAYSVDRRRREIGIRMALGAQRNRIARMIVGETMILVGFGIALGLPTAMLASRLIASQLFGLRPVDPFTFSAACLVLALIAITASYLPTRRAASIEPMRTLRTE
jgi:predicted permease